MSEKLENIDLRSEDIQEILTKVPHWMIRYGNIILLFLIILLFSIAWFVKYPDIIISKAVITTQVPPQREFARVTGKFSNILVENNENVDKGEPLAILENTANYKDVYLLKSIVDTVELNKKSFQFPIDSLPILFLGDINLQYSLFENNYTQYQLNKEFRPFSNEALTNKYSIQELNRQLNNLYARKEISKRELNLSENDLNRAEILYDKGVISEQEYENKQLDFAQSKRAHENFESSISQIKESISLARQTSKGTEINKIREETKLLKNVIQSFNQLKKSIEEWENQYVLKSEINGKVSFLNYWSTNQTVNQGDLVFTIIPANSSSLIAKLKAPILNSGKIKKGQHVNINLQNYPETEFGTIHGRVTNISLFPDEDGLYLIDVKLPKKIITSYNKEIEFKQEMIGSAEIVTEDLRLIERFFYQFKDIFNN